MIRRLISSPAALRCTTRGTWSLAARGSRLLGALAMVALCAGCADPRWLGVNYQPEKLQRDRPPLATFGYYLLNRGLDFFDIFTLNVGVGPALHAELHATNFLRLGAGGAYLASFGLGEQPREAGFFARGLAELSLLFLQTSILHYHPYLSTGDAYDDAYGFEVREPWDQLYRKKRDYWGVGGSIGFIAVGGQAEIHPVQIFDFFAGIVVCDPMQDDL